jgi:hypothetical protein
MKRILMTVILVMGAASLSNKVLAQTGKVTMIFSVYVDDYDTWKTKFDAGAPFRENAGIKVISISRNVEDKNAITIIEEAGSKELATDFLAKLKAVREKNGDKSLANVEIFHPVE